MSRAQAPAATFAPPAEQAAFADEKSPLVAFALPVALTSVGYLLFLAPSMGSPDRENFAVTGSMTVMGGILFLVGPNAGHMYVGEANTALVHSGVRAASAVAIVSGAFWAVFGDCGLFASYDCEPAPGPMLLLAGGLVVGTGSALYSIVDAPFAAHRHNRAARARQLFITPAPMVGPDHSTGLGLQLGGRF